MAEPRPIGERVRTFDDLAKASDDLLRQIATRVHIIDLAYAFRTADEGLRERLLNSVRPSLADEIRAAMKTVDAAELPLEMQVTTARARVMEVARSESTLRDG
jgi:flagellar motor switch protein FliG